MNDQKKNRIVKSNHEFQKIIGKKRFIKNNLFVVYFNKKEDDFLRYGISVGKKLGNAVLRNRAKRQVRMMMRTNLNALCNLKVDLIIMVRKDFIDNPYENSCKSLLKILQDIR
ncbi:ribonuclease P protein component [Spiroplasma alleghenense]|uniref:Ribonuclease P protein component n=1 Tax=Spiroplasma alleghenense TaxID=216931 RepID=A0A345Z5E2_9MOLU|nr:ribonuclease P protein component [Spiroplasma alleghenense]AXK51821.1 ribonuclease P (protein C5) [Spiroplasma alleghenense]